MYKLKLELKILLEQNKISNVIYINISIVFSAIVHGAREAEKTGTGAADPIDPKADPLCSMNVEKHGHRPFFNCFYGLFRC